MKTNSTIRQVVLAFTIVISMAACKKDKNDPEPTPPAEVKAITLTDLKALSTGASIKVPDAKKITGIVISDVSSKNIDSKTLILQEATGQIGIIVSFDAAETFVAGDQVEINISNQTLAQANGEVVLQNVPLANAKKTGTGTITAKTTTAAEIATNKTAWDGTLATIAATELTGGNGKYTGTLTIKDASGTLTSNVLAGAAFENTAYPVSVSSITGIIRVSGTGVRLDLRKAADVSAGAISRVVVEDFSNMTPLVPGMYLGYGGFTTAIGEWSNNQFGGSLGFPISSDDIVDEGNFTTPGRKYLYIDNQSGRGLPCAYTNLAGLKTVSVTFAQSKATTILDSGNPYTFNKFDSSTDYTQISIVAAVGKPDGSAVEISTGVSPKYTVAGQFNTYTFTLPTKEQLVAGGASPGTVDNWLKNPVFAIYNLSKTADNSSQTQTSYILFDKVVFGY